MLDQKPITLVPMTPKQVYDDQVRLQRLSEQNKLGDHKHFSEKSSEDMHSEIVGKKRYTAKERRTESSVKFGEVKRALILKQINIGGRTEQHIKQAHKEFHRLVFEPGDWDWSQLMKERFPVQRRFNLLPRGGYDLRTNPSQERGNDVNKRARRTPADVDVFPYKESSQD